MHDLSPSSNRAAHYVKQRQDPVRGRRWVVGVMTSGQHVDEATEFEHPQLAEAITLAEEHLKPLGYTL